MSDYITFKLWKIGAFLAVVFVYGFIRRWRELKKQPRRHVKGD